MGVGVGVDAAVAVPVVVGVPVGVGLVSGVNDGLAVTGISTIRVTSTVWTAVWTTGEGGAAVPAAGEGGGWQPADIQARKPPQTTTAPIRSGAGECKDAIRDPGRHSNIACADCLAGGARSAGLHKGLLFPARIFHPVIHLFSILIVPLQGDSFAGFNGEAMETKLYVGNLPYSTTEEDLRDLFSQAGSIKSVTIIKDRDTGRSKGFGFVEMETQAEAQQAISMLKETKLGERALTVNLARPREDRGGRGFDKGRGGGRGGFRRDW